MGNSLSDSVDLLIQFFGSFGGEVPQTIAIHSYAKRLS
jgi:hypothetical protein